MVATRPRKSGRTLRQPSPSQVASRLTAKATGAHRVRRRTCPTTSTYKDRATYSSAPNESCIVYDQISHSPIAVGGAEIHQPSSLEIDCTSLPRNYRLPEFILFFADGHTSSIEDIGRFMAQ
ncbi:unnamed protein product [Prunus armeniaca]|uniref:Uncharacterized protein n=1 Tax=Prunus armeniaca TaxID=36596 RepID=A0A6J5UES2_PRUAR|nr:unnamed protein product [Prunus armeniaca]